MKRIIPLVLLLLVAACAPSRFGQLQAAGINTMVTAPAAATHADGSFDNPYLRAAAYPVVVPGRMAVGAAEFVLSPSCEFFAPGKCSPWLPMTPYSIVVESWQWEDRDER